MILRVLIINLSGTVPSSRLRNAVETDCPVSRIFLRRILLIFSKLIILASDLSFVLIGHKH